jgi:hypothetical protein
MIREAIFEKYFHPDNYIPKTNMSFGNLKNSFALAVFVLFFNLGSAWGQNLAIIGSGTTSTSSTGSDPIDGYFNSFRYQVVYNASELTTAGMSANAIVTGLGFSINGWITKLHPIFVSM